MKLRFTMVAEIEIKDLKYYEATSLEEAVANQAKWIDDGAVDPYDLVGEVCKITVEGVQE